MQKGGGCFFCFVFFRGGGGGGQVEMGATHRYRKIFIQLYCTEIQAETKCLNLFFLLVHA